MSFLAGWHTKWAIDFDVAAVPVERFIDIHQTWPLLR